MRKKNSVTVKLTPTDQQAIEILKELTGRTTTTQAMREGLTIAISTLHTLMTKHQLRSGRELREWLMAQSMGGADNDTNTTTDSGDTAGDP